jgi:hypothetical protein
MRNETKNEDKGKRRRKILRKISGSYGGKNVDVGLLGYNTVHLCR